MDELEKSYLKAKSEGIKIKGLVLINPGNPTGTIIGKETIKNIIEFCHRNNLTLLADEVYQENIY
jgi:alanine transaminase